MEDRLIDHLPRLFSSGGYPRWTAGSVPVGAGMPDLIVATYAPQVIALADVEIADTHVLGYLRAVTRARIDTIAERMDISSRFLIRSLYRLVEAQVVSVSDDTALLLPQHRNLLREIVTIEAKVSDWQRAVNQARRNRLFSHRSFVAVPADVASRVKTQPVFSQCGIGLLAVDDCGHVAMVRPSRRLSPSVWTYYYHLASVVARTTREAM
jgi:hypothetical protein